MDNVIFHRGDIIRKKDDPGGAEYIVDKTILEGQYFVDVVGQSGKITLITQHCGLVMANPFKEETGKPCPDCHGTGKIALFTSTVKCRCMEEI